MGRKIQHHSSLILAVILCLGAVGPPLPPLPTVPLKIQKAKLKSPRDAATSGTNAPMVKPLVVLPPPPKVVTLAADYAPTKLTNLTAIMEVRTNLKTGAWSLVGQLLYPTNGGTFRVPYTNTTKEFYFRAGYVIH